MKEIEFRISEDNVKQEWGVQAEAYWRYSSKLIKAMNNRNILSLKIDVFSAKLDLEIRKKPLKYFGKGGKQTEQGIHNIVMTNKEYIELKTSLLEAEKEVSLYSSVLKALEQRKKSLEFYGQLYINSLYSSEPREDSFINKRRERTKK